MKIKVLFILAIAVALSGCATVEHYKAIPLTDAEFAKPLENIRSDYSDVPRYESSWRGIPGTWGDLTDLETKWGKADSVEKRWGERIFWAVFNASLIVAGYLPLEFIAVDAAALVLSYPTEDHYWTKRDTQVRAEVIHTGLLGHGQPQVRMWEWKKVTDGAAKGERHIVTAEQASDTE